MSKRYVPHLDLEDLILDYIRRVKIYEDLQQDVVQEEPESSITEDWEDISDTFCAMFLTKDDYTSKGIDDPSSSSGKQ